MADDFNDMIFKQLWYQTPESNWNSLYTGLDQIYNDKVISYDQYKALKYAIDKLITLGSDFPSSHAELWEQMDHYM